MPKKTPWTKTPHNPMSAVRETYSAKRHTARKQEAKTAKSTVEQYKTIQVIRLHF
jgi:hypothetical protein